MTVEPSDSPSQQQLTRSVAKAFSILESFTERAPSLSFSELAELVDLPSTTLRRLLATLESLGYIRLDAYGRYLLGIRALNLAPPALAGLEVRNQALPILDELSTQTGLNTNLGILHDGRLLYLASVSRNLPRRRYFGVPGRTATAYSTAMGKVLLAHRPPAEVVNLIERSGGLVARTPKTIVDREALIAELERVREQGYALDDEEATIGGRCVAVPVHDRTGEVVAALSVSGMTWEIDMAQVPELMDIATQYADNLAYKLGYAFSTEW